MEDTGKRTDRKSQSVRSRYQDPKSLREGILAFDIDDGLEAGPAALQQEQALDKEQGPEQVTEKVQEPAEEASELEKTKVVPASEVRQAVAKSSSESADGAANSPAEKTYPEDFADTVKIRDAATDKTIVSVTEAKLVRDAANQLPEDDLDDIVKIRDAATDKTIVSVTEARLVREAANRLPQDEEPDDLVKIRDALTDKTIVSVTEAKRVREAANQLDPSMFDEFESGRQHAVRHIEPDMEDFIQQEAVSYEPEDDFDDQDAAYGDDSYYEEDDYEDDAAYDEEDADDFDYEEEREDDYREEERRREEQYRREREREYRRRRNAPPARGAYRDDYYDRYDDYEEGYYDYDDSYRKKRYRRVKSPLRFIPLVLVIALCVLAFITARTICFDTPVNANDYSKIKYSVTADTTSESLAQDLLSLGLIDNPLVFRLRCMFYSAKYVPGEYELSPSYSTEKMINILSGYNYGEGE